MIPEPISRSGSTQGKPLNRSSERKKSSSLTRRWLKRGSIALLLSLMLLMDVLSNIPVVAAASHVSAQLPVPKATYTLQQFLKQGHPYQAKDAPLALPKGTSPTPRGITIQKKASQPKPSAEPPKMKAASQQLPASFLNATTATASAAPLRVVGSDADGVRLEIVIPAGAIDLSKATTSKGTAPQSPLTITVSQLTGHFVGMNTLLSTWKLQITDAQGAAVNGITLRSPASFILHYRKKELQQLDLEPKRLVMSWPTLTSSSDATTAKNAVMRMTNNAAASTLTAQSLVLPSAAATIGISDPMNQAYNSISMNFMPNRSNRRLPGHEERRKA